jgi:hypothetical protein
MGVEANDDASCIEVEGYKPALDCNVGNVTGCIVEMYGLLFKE